MGYYAYDSRGYVADVASIKGWRDFAAWARRQGGELAHLGEHGWTEEMDALRKQLRTLRAGSADLEIVRRGISEAARRAVDVLVITDGVGIEERKTPRRQRPGAASKGRAK